jgi:hypothetical protein
LIAEFSHCAVGHRGDFGDEVEFLGRVEGAEPAGARLSLEQRGHRLDGSLRDDREDFSMLLRDVIDGEGARQPVWHRR